MSSLSEIDESLPVIVVANDPAASRRAVEAVALTNGRVVATVDWAAAADRIALQVGAVTLLADATGAADDHLEALVDAWTTHSAEPGLAIGFAADDTDRVAGRLLDSRAILLSDPTSADWATGLLLATAPAGVAVHDTGDASRIARINEEVARFAETLARLTGSSPAAAAHAHAPIIGDRQVDYAVPPATEEATPADIRRGIRARRLREEVFGVPGLFEDPAWDMLLDLFAAELERRRVSVSSLCIAAAVAPTTALRWITKLIELGLLERRPDEFDRRRAFVALTARASTAMRNYVAGARRAGLAIA